jgi:aldehyde dehydrogenase (NAD+)
MSAFDPDKISIPGGHFIGGRFVDAGSHAIDVARPSDGRRYAGLPIASPEDVDRAVENSWNAFRTSGWARMAPRDRARLLRRWADRVEADVDRLAPLEALGSTRPIREAASWDVPFTAEGIRFFAEHADKHGGEVVPTNTDQFGLTVNEPYGVIGAIAPWNFPLVMASWKIAPALAAGNAVVLKPSELTPFSVLRLAELAVEAGIPPGIFNVVQGDGRVTGDALCRHARVAKVTFTGSTRTGAAIMAACANHGPKPVTLELGGKSPQIVFDDADLDRTAATIARAITSNAGQVCVAGSRLIVAESVAGRVIDRIVGAFAELRPGATWHADTTLSPIISHPQCARIEEIVDHAVTSGATLVTGGGRAETGGDGAFYHPTLLTGVAEDSTIVAEEVFGPVLTVQTFRDEDEALALAAHPAYGLAAGVHTADLGRALRLVRELEAGTVWVNRYGRTADFMIPTGGYKRSGIGKDLGRQAFEANLRTKSVLIDIAAS